MSNYRDSLGYPIALWDLVIVARNDTIHICLVTGIEPDGILVKRFDSRAHLVYTPQLIALPAACVISMMVSPVHTDYWNIRRELMNDSV